MYQSLGRDYTNTFTEADLTPHGRCANAGGNVTFSDQVKTYDWTDADTHADKVFNLNESETSQSTEQTIRYDDQRYSNQRYDDNRTYDNRTYDNGQTDLEATEPSRPPANGWWMFMFILVFGVIAGGAWLMTVRYGLTSLKASSNVKSIVSLCMAIAFTLLLLLVLWFARSQ